MLKKGTFLAVILITCATCFSGEIENSLGTLVSNLIAQFKPDTQHAIIAVLPFENRSTQEQELGRAIAEYLVELVRAGGAFSVVDRMEFEKVMKELALSQTGVIDESRALNAGKALAAQYLLVGTISSALGKAMLNARIIETETAQIKASASVSINPSLLSKFSADLLGEQGKTGSSVFRSMVMPGWGQFFCDRNIRGTLSLTTFLGSAAFTAVAGVLTAQKSSEYNDFIHLTETISGKTLLQAEFEAQGNAPSDPASDEYADAFSDYRKARETRLWDACEKQRTMTIIAGAVTGGIWALNLVDAAIAGNQAKKKVQLYFSICPVDNETRITASMNF
jgi:TolB-like protein